MNYLFDFRIIAQKNRMLQIALCVPALRCLVVISVSDFEIYGIEYLQGIYQEVYKLFHFGHSISDSLHFVALQKRTTTKRIFK